MKSRHIFLKVLLCILLPVLGNIQAWGVNTYYAKVKANISTSTSSTGSGKVYVSANETDDPTYGNGNTITKQQDNNTSFTFYMYAKADEGSEFTGWSTSNTGAELANSNVNPYKYPVTSNAERETDATVNNLYAVFKKLPTFYFSGTATVSPEGAGTASVSLTETSVYGEHWNSTLATTTATFTATANSGYEFVGWYSDAGLTTQVSTNSTYQRPITSTSTNSGSPTNTTLYAKFEPLPQFYFSASAVVSPSGAGTATVTPSSTSVYGEHWNSTSAATNITFSATPDDSHYFVGWSETENGEIINTGSSYVYQMTSNSTNSGSPVNKTLYARFGSYATSITALPSPMEVYVGITLDPITHTVSPQGAYNGHTTYESADPTIATVDASGRVTGVAIGRTTITVKSLKHDNSTVAASTTVSVTVKNKVATPVISFESGDHEATVTLTCATEGVKIYYTKNGNGDPTISDNLYEGAFAVSEGDVIKAIAVKNPADDLWANSDVATDICSLCETEMPEITSEGNSSTGKATVTITAKTGETIYYTKGTSPANPTTTVYDGTGTSSVTINDVPFGTIIKAIAKNSTCRASAPLVKEIAGYSYIADKKVVLDDREDHSWSYYSDPDCPVRSLSPADVKITYLGNGIMMTGTTDYTSGAETGWVREDDDNYVGSAYANRTEDEKQHTFEYHKTLERGANTQTAYTFSSGSQSAAESRCPYTTIPNPFQVRPTYGTPPNSDRASWTGWRGFQCWRLKSVSGGSVYSAASGGTALATGAIINAETQIYFAPNSEYGMSVDLEAVWSIAYIVYATNNGNFSVPNHTTLGYERNFVVLSTNKDFYFGGGGGNNTANITDVNRPSTITPYLPNGTSGNSQIGRVKGVYAQSANDRHLTLQANTKFENVQLNFDNNNNILTAAGYDLIVGRGCSGTINYVRGVGGNVTSPSYTLRIESGTINYLSFLKGYSTTGGTATDASGTLGGTPNVKGVLGCDYDRATNSGITNNLIINNGVFYAYSVSEANGIVYSENALNVHVKSGKIGNSFTINNNYTADAAQAFYIGVAGARVRGHRKLFMEGGEVASIAGGIDATQNQNNNSVTFRMTGGHVRGAVYGGAARSAAYGNRNLIVTGGSITGWIGGGCNGEAYPAGQNDEDVYGGITNGAARVYFGGDATCGGTGSNVNINGSQGGIVFGAGKGVEGNTTSGRMSQGTTVVVADECDIERNVYGGGNFGYAQTSTDVYVSGGTVHGSVFGGSNQNNGPAIGVTMKGGTIKGGLYGGSNTSGTISSNVTMNISGGTVESGVYGGGFGTNSNSCDVSGTVGITMTGGTVLTGLYGGGNVNSKINGKTTVNVNGGTVGASDARANVYGGGLGAATRAKGIVEVNIGSIDNNNVTSGNAIIWGDVYGGSAKGITNCNDAGTAFATGTKTDVTLNAGTLNGSLYGGGHGIDNAEANVWGPVTVVVNGGKVIDPDGANGNPGSVFGCNNAAGSPKSTVIVTVNKTDPTVVSGDNKTYAINGVYGGGNEADYTYTPANNTNSPTVTINGCDSSIKDVYGGGNAASVPQTYVTIYGGDIGRVFGGGNGERGANYPAHVGRYTATNTTYGTGHTNVFIHGGTIGQVFGGSNSNGEIKGTINVVAEKSGTCTMNVGEVYGGGNKAPSNVGSVTIGCMGDNDIIDYVYGGSNDADITGDIGLLIKGGRINNVFGGNNTGHSISGSITVTVDWSKGSCTNNYLGNVFGGGNLAAYTAPSGNYPIVNIKDGTVTYNVYGGGKGSTAVVTGNPQVTVGDLENANNKAEVNGSVFGGGDAANVNGTPTVLIQKTNSIVTSVFGGGNQADVLKNTVVTMTGGTVKDRVFGGGNLGSVGTFTSLAPTTGHTIGKPDSWTENTGKCTVTVSGGTVGDLEYKQMPNDDFGYVFGASRGESKDPTVDPDIDYRAYVKETEVTIIGTAFIIGGVYGGSENGRVRGDTWVKIQGGQIGCGSEMNIPYTEDQWTSAATDVEAGNSSTIQTVSANSDGYTFYGNVFGGGSGYWPYRKADDSGDAWLESAGWVEGNTKVEITGGHILTSVYGGNELTNVSGKCTVKVSGGTIGIPRTATQIADSPINCYVFGAGKGDKSHSYTGDTYVGSTEVEINGGAIYGSAFGGGEAGIVKGSVLMNMKNGTVQNDVYGGGALANTNTNNVTAGYGTASETIPSTSTNKTEVNLTGGTIKGSVYGGGLGQKSGFFGKTSDVEAKVYGNVTVKLNETVASDNCWVKGNIFGCNNLNGTPKGHALVHIYKTVTKNANGEVLAKPAKNNNIYELAAVYGGGNMAAYEPVSNTDFAEVIIDGCDYTSIETIYGGGNAASAPATSVTVNQTYEIGTIFGGGNGKDDLNNGTINLPNPGAHVGYKAANYTYDTSKTKEENETALDAAFEAQKNGLEYGTGEAKVNAFGGMIHKIFGGSNTKGNVRHESEAFIDERYSNDCPLQLDEVYGGGNEAYMDGGSSVKLGCISYLKTLYGGANAAFVGGDVVLNVTSGTFDRVFGGNNTSGTINGSITVNIEEVGCHPVIIGELYGCGNLASYTTPSGKTHPTINVKSFTSIGRIFGGGLGSSAKVTGNPTVYIDEVLGKHAATPYASTPIYYHDNSANPTEVTSYITMPAREANKIGAIGTVYGGGNAAPVEGDTQVKIGTKEYIPLTVTEGSSVTGYYTRSGEVYTEVTDASAVAASGTTYYKKVVGVDIRNNVFGAGLGRTAVINGNTNVQVGKEKVNP